MSKAPCTGFDYATFIIAMKRKQYNQSVTNQVGACNKCQCTRCNNIYCDSLYSRHRQRDRESGQMERVREFCESCAYYHADHHDDGHDEGPRRSGQKIAQLCKNVNCDAEWRSGEFRVRRNQLEVKETL